MTLDSDSPVTFDDMANLFMMVIIEVMAHATPTSAAADQALTEIASKMLDYSNNTTNARSALGFRMLAEKLIGTEPGSDPV